MGSQGQKKRRKVSSGRRRPGEQVYRMSDRTIRKGTIILGVSMVALFVTGLVMTIVGYNIAMDIPGAHFEESPIFIAGIVVMISAFVVPILTAAVLGAEALHRGGWPVGVVLTAGGAAVVYGRVNESGVIEFWGWVATVVAGVGFFVLGFIRRVPMGIGAPGDNNVSDGRLPGESRPGQLK